jgi:dsRNA-specific ribonuclease
MKIEYHNDHKGKYQSWTATATAESINGDLHLEAYGATKEEAEKALAQQILQTTIDLLGVIEKL